MSRAPTVEPLDDLAWTRVERGVFARLDAGEPAPVPIAVSRRPSALLGAVAVAIAAIVIGAIFIGRGTTPAPIIAIPYDAPVDDHAPLRFEAGPAPSEVTVGPMFATLDARTTLLVTRDSQAPVAILDEGAAWFTIESRTGRAPFVVVAGDVTIRVMGTRFRVARHATGTDVAVEHGTVEVVSRGSTRLLGAGEHWSSVETGSITPPIVDEVPPVDAEVPVKPDKPAKPDKAATIDKPAPLDKPAPVDKPATIDERARFEELAALEVSKPDAAIAGYLVLARGTSTWAQLALFAAARLATDRGDARAVSLLQTYLRRFPSGPNADDARELLRQQKGPP